MKKNLQKRLVALVVAVAMCMLLLPIPGMAEGEKVITSVALPSDVASQNVAYGTALTSLNLPSTLSVEVEDIVNGGTTTEIVNVTWDCIDSGGYQPTEPNRYDFKAVLSDASYKFSDSLAQRDYMIYVYVADEVFDYLITGFSALSSKDGFKTFAEGTALADVQAVLMQAMPKLSAKVEDLGVATTKEFDVTAWTSSDFATTVGTYTFKPTVDYGAYVTKEGATAPPQITVQLTNSNYTYIDKLDMLDPSILVQYVLAGTEESALTLPGTLIGYDASTEESVSIPVLSWNNSYNKDVEDEYTFTPQISSDYYMVGVSLPTIKVVVTAVEDTSLRLYVDNESQTVYANGQPILIDTNDGSMGSIKHPDTNEVYKYINIKTGEKQDRLYNYLTLYNIFGGWKNGSDANASTRVIVTGGSKNSAVRRVYGGSESGTFTGTTSVAVQGSLIYAVYGGNKDGTFNGTTNVSVSGSGYIGNSETPLENGIYGGNRNGTFSGTANVTLAGGYVSSGNVAGGNYSGSFSGQTNIAVSGGAFHATIMGGNANGNFVATGNIGSTIMVTGADYIEQIVGGSSKGDYTGNTKITATGSDTYINGSIYGACEYGNLTGNTLIQITDLEDDTFVHGGARYGDVTGNTKVEATNSFLYEAYGGSQYGSVNGDTEVIVDSCWGNATVVGGNLQANNADTTDGHVTGTAHVTIKGDSKISEIFGGTESSNADTKVNKTVIDILGGTIGTIYGGNGNGGTVGTTTINIKGGSVTDLYGGNWCGGVVTTTNVNAAGGTIGTLRGGTNGSGKGSEITTVNITVDGATVDNVYGGSYWGVDGSPAKVGTVNLKIGETKATTITGSVFGGGHYYYTSTETTNVNIYENAVLASTFAGTNRLMGGGSGTSDFVTNANLTIHGGTINTYVVGGGATKVTNATLIIDGGAFANMVFAGGWNADVDIAKVTINGGTFSGDVYGGGFGKTTGKSTVTVNGGNLKSLLAGGNSATALTKDAAIAVKGGAIEYVYGGGINDTVEKAVIAISGGAVSGNVYLGGVANGGTATVKDAKLTLSAGGAIGQSIYMGGSGNASKSSATAVTKAEVDILGGAIGTDRIHGYGLLKDLDLVDDMVIKVHYLSALNHRFYFDFDNEPNAEVIVDQQDDVASYIVKKVDVAEETTAVHDFLTPYKLTLGTKMHTVTFYNKDNYTVLKQIQVADGTVIPANQIPADPADDVIGYMFTGWKTKVNGGVADRWSFSNVVNSDLDLYQHWPATYHTIVFNSNGGTDAFPEHAEGLKDRYKIEHNTKAYCPANDPTKKGYTFGGWYTDNETFLNEYDFDTIRKSPITLHAKWIPNIYTVKFDSQGGTPVTEQKIEYRKKATEPVAPTKEGFVFDGWYDQTYTYAYIFDYYVVTADITLYAKWIPLYNVTFVCNGGTAISPQVVKYEEKATKPADPTKAGYAFEGWYKDQDTFIQAYAFDDAVTNHITLYAKWRQTDFTVTYNGNGATGNMPASPVTVAQGSNYGVSGTIPTRAGFTFTGWVREDNQAVYQARATFTMPSANVILTARWRANVVPSPSVSPSPSPSDSPSPSVVPSIEPSPSPSDEPIVTPPIKITPEDRPKYEAAFEAPDVEKMEEQTGNIITDIFNNNVPLAGHNSLTWALLNLILLLIAAVVSVLLVIFMFVRKRANDDDDDAPETETKYIKRSKGLLWRVLAIVMAVLALVVFLITENTSLPMVWTDNWTIWMFVMNVVQVIAIIVMKFSRRRKHEDETTSQYTQA